MRVGSGFIDKLIEEGWKKAGVKPAEAASDAEFLRRVYVDMLGRIPNIQEAKAFLSTRESDRRGKLDRVPARASGLRQESSRLSGRFC